MPLGVDGSPVFGLDNPLTENSSVCSEKLTFYFEGEERIALKWSPSGSCKGKATIVALHGLGGYPGTWAPLGVAAAERGFAVVAPVGIGKSWNAGLCCGESLAQKRDDYGFLKKLISKVASKPAAGVGFSNGGLMVTMASDLFFAVAPFSGYDYAVNATTRPVILHHGEKDHVVRIQGCCPMRGKHCCCGIGERWARPCVDFSTVFQRWAHVNKCTGPSYVSRSDQQTTCVSATECEANTTMCTSHRLGHAVPGLRPRGYAGSTMLHRRHVHTDNMKSAVGQDLVDTLDFIEDAFRKLPKTAS